jgi:DNA-binding GntR family transcriptional regulator
MNVDESANVLNWAPGERPEGLQAFVSQRIREAILSGAVKAGVRLYPSRIASDLGVSHIPVREALSTLDATGHVRHVPRLGYFVADLSYEVIADTYRMRELLEHEAHRLVIDDLRPARLQRMQALNQEMIVALRRGDSAGFVRLNRAFHFEPFGELSCDWPLRFLNHLWDVAARYQASMTTVRVSRNLLINQHNNILDGFASRDLAALDEAMTQHRCTTLDVMAKLKDADQSTGVVTARESPHGTAT